MNDRPRDDLLNSSLSAKIFAGEQVRSLPSRAQVVIVGGGIVGTSVAYHLTALGVGDVLLLDRSVVSAGTTWHAAGLVAGMRASHALTELASYGLGLYRRLQDETGIDVGFNPCGALSVARTPQRVDELRYVAMVGRHHGMAVEELEPDAISELWPLASARGLEAVFHHPGDGTVNPGWAAVALAKGAFDREATICENVQVERILKDGARAVGVETDQGVIDAETVVLCAGMWSRDLAAQAGVSLPLWPAEHVHVTTAPVQLVEDGLPVLRDFDGYLYVRSYRDRLMVGAFEPEGKPRAPESFCDDFAFGEFEPDWDHFEPVRRKAVERVPALGEVRFERFLSAPESFTPDQNFLLGETAEVAGLFTACGFNSQGIIFGPGAGRALAEWIIEGASTSDTAAVDCTRFAKAQNNARYLDARTRESLGRVFAMHWPHLQPTAPRDIRRTPLHARLAAVGACFGEANGWERANWYAPAGTDPTYEYSYARQNWFSHVADEHRAARDDVALFDLSSFAKTEVAGAGACDLLQRTCTQNIDVEAGRVVYTLFCNERGGIELDGTVTRLEEARFLVLTPGTTQHKTLNWLRRLTGPVPPLGIYDATSGMATLAVMGPASRDLLSAISPNDFSQDAFRWGRAQEVDVGEARVLALRISFVGELGWELYVPTEYALNVYDAVTEAGHDFGLVHAGYHALESLRLEKGYPHLGHDIGPADDPFQAGLGFTVRLEKDVEFEGRAALVQLAGEPVARQRVFVKLEDPEPLLLGAESIRRDGSVVGRLTSGGFGHTLGASVGMGYVDAHAAEDGPVEIFAGQSWHAATLQSKPFYDADNLRLRGLVASAT